MSKIPELYSGVSKQWTVNYLLIYQLWQAKHHRTREAAAVAFPMSSIKKRSRRSVNWLVSTLHLRMIIWSCNKSMTNFNRIMKVYRKKWTVQSMSPTMTPWLLSHNMKWGCLKAASRRYSRMNKGHRTYSNLWNRRRKLNNFKKN